MKSLIVFASGRGSNTQAIIDYFNQNGLAKVNLIVSNNNAAPVLEIAKNNNIPFLIVNKKTFEEPLLIEQMMEFKPDLIVLAGFLWKIPSKIIQLFPHKLINIHPALLPKYGGKGMYGSKVHEAVLASTDKESGITIHFVNEAYDEGTQILQARCNISKGEHAASLAKKIGILEAAFFPKTIEYLLSVQ